ncbi:MAG TPA: YlzJ-like family protein [Ruminiclostridium sp.]
MILYTIFDASVIFKNGSIDEQQANANYCEMNVDGIVVQVSQSSSADTCVERIISTNPADYLNPKLQPGCVIQK